MAGPLRYPQRSSDEGDGTLGVPGVEKNAAGTTQAAYVNQGPSSQGLRQQATEAAKRYRTYQASINDADDNTGQEFLKQMGAWA